MWACIAKGLRAAWFEWKQINKVPDQPVRKDTTSRDEAVDGVAHRSHQDPELVPAVDVLLLQTEEIDGPVKRKSLEIVKNRYAGDLDTMPLIFSKPFLSFSQKALDLLKKEPVRINQQEKPEESKKMSRKRKEKRKSGSDEEVHFSSKFQSWWKISKHKTQLVHC